ncbi:MAG: hypothetical protein MUC59_01085 [Saprospiraceae bacterium]|nr:hypothetical protein [Saprospiraceae bacterium]
MRHLIEQGLTGLRSLVYLAFVTQFDCLLPSCVSKIQRVLGKGSTSS